METQRLYPRAQNYSKDQRFPAISKPSIVGFFNLNDKREYEEDISSLDYFKLNPDKKVEFDLNVMENRHQDKPDSADNENLDHILTFIQKSFECLRSNKPKQLLNSDFICFRGLLRLLMCTPYENRDPWLIRATKFKGSIYLCALDTQEKIQERANRNEMNEKFRRYGFKFEQYLFAEFKNQPNANRPVIEAEEFCIMFQTKINNQHKILYGGEIDGVESKSEITNLEELRHVRLVEVKVKKSESNQRQYDNFLRNKARNWWAQSFLVGIQEVYAGLRNDNGLVHRVEKYPLKEVVDESKQFWNAAICMKFLEDFLTKVKQDMIEIDCPYTVFLYDYQPSRHSDDYIKKIEFWGRNPNEFLSRPYVEYLSKIRNIK